MLPEIQKLLIVQDRDVRILGLRNDLKRIPMEEAMAHQKLDGDKAAVASATAALQATEVAIKNLELDIQTRQDSIAKLKVQQFQTRKNAEFQAMTHEIERYGKEVTALEDRELELMETAEGQRAVLKTAKAAYADTSAIIETDLAKLVERKGHCEAAIAEQEAERATHTEGIDEFLLSQYDRIFKHKGDSAVAPLTGGICGGCHMKVTASTLNKAKGEKEIAQCEQCGRMLYFAG
jgi:predicted  nucleic acid-binding Zn-ribbon protein